MILPESTSNFVMHYHDHYVNDGMVIVDDDLVIDARVPDDHAFDDHVISLLGFSFVPFLLSTKKVIETRISYFHIHNIEQRLNI